MRFRRPSLYFLPIALLTRWVFICKLDTTGYVARTVYSELLSLLSYRSPLDPLPSNHVLTSHTALPSSPVFLLVSLSLRGNPLLASPLLSSPSPSSGATPSSMATSATLSLFPVRLVAVAFPENPHHRVTCPLLSFSLLTL